MYKLQATLVKPCQMEINGQCKPTKVADHVDAKSKASYDGNKEKAHEFNFFLIDTPYRQSKTEGSRKKSIDRKMIENLGTCRLLCPGGGWVGGDKREGGSAKEIAFPE